MGWKLLAAALAAMALTGCEKRDEAAAATTGVFGWNGHKARYVGVGLYQPGELWTHLARTAQPAAPAAATLGDDDEIIVLLDSATGELRQCGNLSGHCLAMNPWADPLDPAGAAPAKLLKHAKQLREEAEAAAAAEARKASARDHGG